MTAPDATVPLLLTSGGKSNDDVATAAWMSLATVPRRGLAVCIAVLVTLLDNFPYGFLLFPMSAELQGVGVSMVLLSAAVSQLVFACSSSFDVGLGCMIVENIPMLHSMANSVALSLVNFPEMVVPTLLALYTTASLLTAAAFLLLGYFQMDRLFMLLPKPVLTGCVGGMGIYILCAGVSAVTNIPWVWTLHVLWLQALEWKRVVLLCLLEVLLLSVKKVSSRWQGLEPFVLPVFFLGLIPLSWAAIFVAGLSHKEAQAEGWFFSDLPPSQGLVAHWQLFSLREVAWWVFPQQLPVLLGIVVFSCLHVPVNVPALGHGTRRKFDINQELTAHGLANLAAAMLGLVQNYMVYSSSVLYFKCGGGSRLASAAISIVVMGCIPHIGMLIPLLPRSLAGVLLMHLGYELIWESLVDTWRVLDLLEYAIVLGIAGVCTISFMEGFLAGLLCACIAFAVQASRSDPVEAILFPGRGIRSHSRRLRSVSEVRELEAFDQEGGVFVMRLRGALFFGNTHELPKRVEGVTCKKCILDFSRVLSIDSSAFSQLDSIAASLLSQGVELLCSGLLSHLLPQMRLQPHMSDVRVLPDMNSALEKLEQEVLQQVAGTKQTIPVAAEMFKKSISPNNAEGTGWSLRYDAEASASDCFFFDETCASLMEPIVANEDVQETCAALRGYFRFERVPAGSFLWKPGDAANFAFLLVSGHVGVLDDHRNNCGQEGCEFVESSERGQFTGELNLFTGDARKNAILATEDLSMWTVTRASLEQMQRKHLQLAFVLQGIALRYASHRMYLSMLDGRVHTV